MIYEQMHGAWLLMQSQENLDKIFLQRKIFPNGHVVLVSSGEELK